MGVVDQVTASRVVGEKRKYRLYKFVLNNQDNCRVEILVWGEMISQYEPNIQLNSKVFLDNLRCKATPPSIFKTENNLVPVELNVQSNSTIEFLGTVARANPMEAAPTIIHSFGEIFQSAGRICKFIFSYNFLYLVYLFKYIIIIFKLQFLFQWSQAIFARFQEGF